MELGLPLSSSLMIHHFFLLYVILKTTALNLNHDLGLISAWANQWKMCFNPDPTKPAEEVIFSQKINKPIHPPLYFNNMEVKRVVIIYTLVSH